MIQCSLIKHSEYSPSSLSPIQSLRAPHNQWHCLQSRSTPIIWKCVGSRLPQSCVTATSRYTPSTTVPPPPRPVRRLSQSQSRIQPAKVWQFFQQSCLLTMSAQIYLENSPLERKTHRHQYSKATIWKSNARCIANQFENQLQIASIEVWKNKE